MPEVAISVHLATASITYGLTDASAWLVQDVRICNDPALNPVPREANRAATYEHATADTLGILTNLRYYVGRDSALLLYRRIPKKRSKSGTSLHLLKNKHPSHKISGGDIKAGNTIRDNLIRLPTEGQGSHDITLVVCMINDVSTDAVTAFAETSTIGSGVVELCRRLNEFRRPILVVGGEGRLWGLQPGLGRHGRYTSSECAALSEYQRPTESSILKLMERMLAI